MSPRPVPRPFQFHWGGGQIIEEASHTGEHTAPAIRETPKLRELLRKLTD